MSDGVPALDHGADTILEGEHIPAPEQLTSPERALWLAVLGTAWVDAFEGSDFWLSNTDRSADPELIRNESRRWLTLDFGNWKQDRETVCHLAGIDSDMLRQAARKKLAEVKRGAEPTAEVLSLDQAFAKLLEVEGSMDAEDIDAALAQLAKLELAA
ncbi:MAG: hypothetical protein WDZ84_05000 [Rhodovibrionaceae bacterium]